MREIRPEDIRNTTTAIEFALQELRKTNEELAKVRQRLNTLEENSATMEHRTSTLRRKGDKLDSGKVDNAEYLNNMDRIESQLSGIRKRLDRIQGVHGS